MKTKKSLPEHETVGKGAELIVDRAILSTTFIAIFQISYPIEVRRVWLIKQSFQNCNSTRVLW